MATILDFSLFRLKHRAAADENSSTALKLTQRDFLRRHILEQKARIALQQRFINKLGSEGIPTLAEQGLLLRMENLLTRMRKELNVILLSR